MSYRFTGRIRYSEIGEDGCLTLPGILNYFQDCSTFQSESLHLGVEELKKRNRVWVLSSWQVIVERYPGLGEEVETATWAYGFKGFIGTRNFTMKTADGEMLAYANTFWTYLDIERGVPARLTEADTAGYEIEEKLPVEFAPRKIYLPPNCEKHGSFTVQKHHLDTNHHVNNCQYVRMAEDYLPDGFTVHQMRAEYKKQARFGNVICPETCTEDGKFTVLLNTERGEPYAVVEFQDFIRQVE
ncbi:MAG: thioesterase [Eubacteriales bacterium]|nr:thioesterase [Eubacteriales bacterium]